MGLKQVVILGAVGLIALAAAGLVLLMLLKPWLPPVEMTDPGPQGRRIAQSGLVASYYPARGTGLHPGVLLLGGSEGALGSSVTRIAKALQGEGFAVLHLSYFRAPGQSPRLALVPLETFDRGLAWLKAQPGVGDRLAVVGGSKGAEAALLVATRHPELRAVVAGMPSSVVWPGIDWEKGSVAESSWSAAGAPLAAVPYGGLGFKGGRRGIYDRGLATLSAHPAARIPIETSPAVVLLVCGQADSLWPSCPMAEQLKARDPNRVRVLAYPNGGHGVFGPPLPQGDPRYARLSSLGGTAQGNNAARRDGWPKVTAFLHTRLNGPQL